MFSILCEENRFSYDALSSIVNDIISLICTISTETPVIKHCVPVWTWLSCTCCQNRTTILKTFGFFLFWSRKFTNFNQLDGKKNLKSKWLLLDLCFSSQRTDQPDIITIKLCSDREKANAKVKIFCRLFFYIFTCSLIFFAFVQTLGVNRPLH